MVDNSTSKAVVKKSSNGKVARRSPIAELAHFLEGRKAEIAKVLPEGLSVERVVKTAIMAAMENPDIGEKCTSVSIYRSVMQAALMGLTVGGGFNEGYFIRYGDSCTFRASYLGWAKVATRSGDIDLIRASVVYSNDDFDISEQPPAARHKPLWEGGQRGSVVGSMACAYSINTLNDGSTSHTLRDFTFVPAEDLDAAREQADQFKASPAWRTWPDEMRKKVAIRRLCKMLPRNEALSRLTRIENSADSGVVDVPDPEALPETDDINKMVVDSRFEEANPVTVAAENEVPPPAVQPTVGGSKRKSTSSRLKEKMTNTKSTPQGSGPPDYGSADDVEF